MYEAIFVYLYSSIFSGSFMILCLVWDAVNVLNYHPQNDEGVSSQVLTANKSVLSEKEVPV